MRPEQKRTEEFGTGITVESVREEFRSAFLMINLFGGMHKIERHKDEAETAKRGLFVLAQFGVRSKLISPQEGNDYLAVLRGELPSGPVLMKWDSTTSDEAYEASLKIIEKHKAEKPPK